MSALHWLAAAGVILGAVDVIAVGIGAWILLGHRRDRRATGRQAARTRHPVYRGRDTDVRVPGPAPVNQPSDVATLRAIAAEFSPRAARKLRRLSRRIERAGGVL